MLTKQNYFHNGLSLPAQNFIAATVTQGNRAWRAAVVMSESCLGLKIK